MRRRLMLFCAAITLTILAQAQTDSTTTYANGRNGRRPVNPARRAVRQLNNLQEKLNLTRDQVSHVHTILLDEDIALDSLRNHPTGNKKQDALSRRDILQDADKKITTLLTDTQKPLYAQWKEEQKQNMRNRRKNNNGGAAADSSAYQQ